MGGAPNTTELSTFSASRFLKDFKKLASAIDASYSEKVLNDILDTFHQYFRDFVVVWRATDRPGDALNFRIYTGPQARNRNTTAVAVAGGFLEEDNALSPLIESWGALYDDTTEMIDFSADSGLEKTWVYLGQMRPTEDILQARDVPESIRRHAPTFQRLGLHTVRFVCVNYESNTVNIYFYTDIEITVDRTSELVALAGCPPLSEDDALELRKWVNPQGYPFAVTIDVATGDIKRVAFYALRLPDGEFPKVKERLAKFYKHAPSYDDTSMNTAGWSFGKGGSRYMKGERSYTGNLLGQIQGVPGV